uniref:PIR Superfamily Protein n=1 Tax=Panagrolaimus davidi TaxID=227884 RepID=A0A914PDA1_9BILA
MSNRKKTFALLTVPSSEKVLEILTFNDAEIILRNKYFGKDFMEDASNYLLDLKKNSKNLEDVILDFCCHENPEFLHEIRKYSSEFCENKVILFRLVYQNIIFTSMLLFHYNMDFNPEDTVYSIWIKNYISYKLENSTLYFINEMKIDDNFMENEKYDSLFDCENPPKFLVHGSLASDSR